MFRDAKIINQSLTAIEVNISIQKTLQIKSNLIKVITFDQFLNCVFTVSELKEQQLFTANPKAALTKVICEKFIPLLVKIENNSYKPSICKKKSKYTSINYSRVEACQKQIVYNDDTLAVFTDIMPLLRSVYAHYFDMDISSQKGMIKKSTTELRRMSLKACLDFCTDFKVSPFMVSQRTCFFIWQTLADVKLK